MMPLLGTPALASAVDPVRVLVDGRCPTRRGARCRRSGGRARPAARRRRSSRRGARRAAPTCRRPARWRPGAARAGSPRPAGCALYARTPSKPCSASSAGSRGARRSAASSAPALTTSSCPRPSRSAKRRRVAAALGRDALGAEALRPEVERLLRGDAPDDAVDHAGARAARDRARVLEERQVDARAALLVAVEQVVDARVVLVDGLGDQPQAQDAGVEVEVARARRP